MPCPNPKSSKHIVSVWISFVDTMDPSAHQIKLHLWFEYIHPYIRLFYNGKSICYSWDLVRMHRNFINAQIKACANVTRCVFMHVHNGYVCVTWSPESKWEINFIFFFFLSLAHFLRKIILNRMMNATKWEKFHSTQFDSMSSVNDAHCTHTTIKYPFAITMELLSE